jgi:hypothetical protein
LHQALEHAFYYATKECGDPRAADVALAKMQVRQVLARFSELNGHDYEEIRRGNVVDVLMSPNVVHFSWFLGEDDYAKAMPQILADPAVRKLHLGTKFWRAYSDGLSALHHRKPYEIPPIKPKGVEQFWFAYLRWISDLTTGRDASVSREQIRVMFERRQRDSRWQSFWFEGRPSYEAKWDLRVESVERYLARRSA